MNIVSCTVLCYSMHNMSIGYSLLGSPELDYEAIRANIIASEVADAQQVVNYRDGLFKGYDGETDDPYQASTLSKEFLELVLPFTEYVMELEPSLHAYTLTAVANDVLPDANQRINDSKRTALFHSDPFKTYLVADALPVQILRTPDEFSSPWRRFRGYCLTHDQSKTVSPRKQEKLEKIGFTIVEPEIGQVAAIAAGHNHRAQKNTTTAPVPRVCLDIQCTSYDS